MSMRYKGGVISATPPTTSQSSASGSWTLQQQMQATAAGNWPINGPFNWIEDVFSTWLYTGNGSTQTITNGIDLAGKGGLVWIKARDGGDQWHRLFDTNRGSNFSLVSNDTTAQINNSNLLSSFGASGFNLGSDGTGNVNSSGRLYGSWTFRKQPKFFDVVTYTGDGVAGRTVAHNLGSVPGCIIVKHTSGTSTWRVYHRSLGATSSLILNSTSSATASSWNSTDPTSTVFSVSDSLAVNASGETYVAYLFAHNAGGFGLTGTDNVISCGSYTGNGSATGPVVTLGYEPQWLLVKPTNFATDWSIIDNMRGAPWGSDGQILQPNTSAAETNRSVRFNPTGFQPADTFADFNRSATTYIYIAIRRGPMKVPTTGTSVYNADIGNNTGTGLIPEFISGFPVDMVFDILTTGGVSFYPINGARLMQGQYLVTSNSTAQDSSGNVAFDYQNGYWDGSAGSNRTAEMFRRAPGFMDVVCYTGTGSNRAITHNLAAVPELMIIKSRTTANDWQVYYGVNTNVMVLNSTAAATTVANVWNNTSPTSTQFTVGTAAAVNGSGANFVAYLFASVAGVSKVGTYVGNGTSQTIDCGFPSGARFVLTKPIDATGSWLVWDTARGMVAGNNRVAFLNNTSAEISANTLYTVSTGFQLVQSFSNTSGVTYLFLAIA